MRGTVLAESDSGCVVLSAATTGKAAYILTDNVDATEEIGTTGYRAGNFNTKALIVAEGYELTEADRDSLRKYCIVLNENMQ